MTTTITKIRFALLGAFTLAGSVYAQSNSIQAISTLNQGGKESIKIDFKNPLAKTPEGFAIQTPARIALDFPSTANALGKNLVDINSSAVKSANVVQVGDRTRVVLNLKQSSPYQPSLSGNSLLVSLNRGGSTTAIETTAVPPATASTFAESRNNSVLAIRDMDFRRGADGAGRLIVTLPNNQVGVDIKQQGAALALEFPRTALPEGLRRKLDVADFGTPVQTITAYQSGDKVKVLVDARGNWSHSAYQGDNQFVLEVRPQKIDPNKLNHLGGSIAFGNPRAATSLRILIQSLNALKRKGGGMSLVASSGLGGLGAAMVLESE